MSGSVRYVLGEIEEMWYRKNSLIIFHELIISSPIFEFLCHYLQEFPDKTSMLGVKAAPEISPLPILKINK